MPVKAIHHVDLAVADVERSLAFYLALLGPLGVEEAYRYATYRGSEQVVYLRIGSQLLGFRCADGGEHRYYGVGLEHLAITVETRDELNGVHARCLEIGANVQFPPEEDRDIPGYWALFVFDPDGFRLEVVHWPGEEAYEPG
ncbi:MAG: VOC family protein [Actinomycetota bacterium]|nr:VOC family protein [Actinomycetota bacterium]